MVTGSTLFIVGTIGIYLAVFIWATTTRDSSKCTNISSQPSSCMYKKEDQKDNAEKYIKANFGYATPETSPPAETDSVVDTIWNYYSCYNNPSTELAPTSQIGLDSDISPISEENMLTNNLCRMMGCSSKQCLLIESSCDTSTATKKDFVKAECVTPTFRSAMPVIPFSLGGFICVVGITCIVLSLLCFKDG
uniref:Uncharacterized protein n=1 Tax=Chromera velia CCMP2878 TaxID=1169474 RepID=A0A0G4HQE9_9ALVE|mmetsp:Transcript_5281/g.10458  ORF Transcript_5281/g.10458 Transcript_5281/m.10458 type:complete len:192 (-) Transcript_5281:704-1279(-)|eukprot:Cvel_7926.t1-p1 / transcript=Cvel_7926.t1 / gene=Cvel_7926 / organism=Chromera_velia_CCMP2878 / gene_product=hypothetical protein / transcript_product=hypothetical protein / location=Cvel_scaffold425:28161-31617(-) / protein_length=191 / sequence_SO=supercontig / SO=protein_coding / is_pseudo=false